MPQSCRLGGGSWINQSRGNRAKRRAFRVSSSRHLYESSFNRLGCLPSRRQYGTFTLQCSTFYTWRPKGSLGLKAKFSLGNIIENLQCTYDPGRLPFKSGTYAWKTEETLSKAGEHTAAITTPLPTVRADWSGHRVRAWPDLQRLVPSSHP